MSSSYLLAVDEFEGSLDILPSFIEIKVCLTLVEVFASHHIVEDGYRRYLTYPFGYHLTLVIASFPLSSS